MDRSNKSYPQIMLQHLGLTDELCTTEDITNRIEKKVKKEIDEYLNKFIDDKIKVKPTFAEFWKFMNIKHKELYEKGIDEHYKNVKRSRTAKSTQKFINKLHLPYTVTFTKQDGLNRGVLVQRKKVRQQAKPKV